MAVYDHDSDFVRWGLRLLSVEDDPVLNYNYYGDGNYQRQSYGEDSNNIESDEIIAHTLQEEFSRLDAAESAGYSEPSYVTSTWQSPPRNYSSDNDCGREEDNGFVNSSSCSSPGGDQGEYLQSPELSDDYTNDDDEVYCKFDQMTAIPHVPRINGEIPSIDEATSDHQRLLDRLQSFGFVEHKVQGDGNCQFRALSDQLYNTPENHKSVRHRIVNQLKSHTEIYEGYVPMPYDDYLEKMSKSGEWGDHVTLQAAADVYGVKIIVLTSFKDTYYIEILPKFQKPKRVICLSFWAEVHYNSIYPQGDAPSGESRKKRKWWNFGNRH